MTKKDLKEELLRGLEGQQPEVVKSSKRRILVVAGAGSGKTEVMARRIAWWVLVDEVPKDSIVAFTFTEKAAEEMKFRIRKKIEELSPGKEDVSLGGMYVGTIHSFCLKLLRELKSDEFYDHDILDEAGRLALLQRGYYGVLAMGPFKENSGLGQYDAIDLFFKGYDLLHEYNQFDVKLPSGPIPHRLEDEKEWCKKVELKTKVGTSGLAKAFAETAARYYAFLRCRRFLDFSTSQSEAVRLLAHNKSFLAEVRSKFKYLVVDEVQDINPVQDQLIRLLVGREGALTAVGDHRQAIYSFRGGRVDLMAEMYKEIDKSADGQVYHLEKNFRSTPAVIDLANRWSQTITPPGTMMNSNMAHGTDARKDLHDSHIGMRAFADVESEVEWIADQIKKLVKKKNDKGAAHDKRGKGLRGISYSDIAILIRSTTDLRVFIEILEQKGVPVIFRSGSEFFSRPEVLLFLSCLARAAGLDDFYVSNWNRRFFGNRVQDILACAPNAEDAIAEACAHLARLGLPIKKDLADRLILGCDLLKQRMFEGKSATTAEIKKLKSIELQEYVRKAKKPRRVFPQEIFQLFLSEAEVHQWDNPNDLGVTLMFHLGQVSSLVKQMEAAGWTDPFDFKLQVISLLNWGAQNARADEAELLIPPDAVTLSTIHGSKGLEYGAVFLANVNAQRFPSSNARRAVAVPFDSSFYKHINPAVLSDNDNNDDERRLMYVALTRAERYLFVTAHSKKQSRFWRELEPLFDGIGRRADRPLADLLKVIDHKPIEVRKDFRLATSFSDLRYFMACPHDFYLRKVLGFAPTIDQAFGYGRGIHNLMRIVHSDPKKWAKLAKDPGLLKKELQQLIDRGVFYLRYTTSDPAENMRSKAMDLVGKYVAKYAGELEHLNFEPEKPFETLIPQENVLISGAIDVIRLDHPPRVTLIDFKSGGSDVKTASGLDSDEMALQISVYGIAAKKELEYEPERGLVRYLDAKSEKEAELKIDLKNDEIEKAKKTVIRLARGIKDQGFHEGPRSLKGKEHRCTSCDFLSICGMKQAAECRAAKKS